MIFVLLIFSPGHQCARTLPHRLHDGPERARVGVTPVAPRRSLRAQEGRLIGRIPRSKIQLRREVSAQAMQPREEDEYWFQMFTVCLP